MTSSGRCEEVAQLALDAKAGSQAAQERLWLATHRFIEQQARKRLRLADSCTRQLYDDLVQSGYLAMIDAVRVYHPERGAFLTCLGYHLRNQFNEVLGLRTYKDDAMKRRPESLDAPITGADGEEYFISDAIADPDSEAAFEEVATADYGEYLSRGIAETSSGDIAEVMWFMTANGCGLSEAARRLGKDKVKMKSKFPNAKRRLDRWINVRV